MNCPLCLPSPHLVLWQDDFCRVVLLGDVDYPGYCRVELIDHVKEMTDLPIHLRSRLMQIVCVVEQVIRDQLKPTKVNLASLGNKTPHLHWHVIPRFESDKHFPNSHWGEAVRDAHPVELNSLQITDLTTAINTKLNG
jgi:diadenosine tetraphosphate (Ap4A) HIT family hydrolase